MPVAQFSLGTGPGDLVLIVRITEGGRRRRRVFSVPLNALEPYERPHVTAEQHRQLDDLFTQQRMPKAEAAVVRAIKIFDGSS